MRNVDSAARSPSFSASARPRSSAAAVSARLVSRAALRAAAARSAGVPPHAGRALSPAGSLAAPGTRPASDLLRPGWLPRDLGCVGGLCGQGTNAGQPARSPARPARLQRGAAARLARRPRPPRWRPPHAQAGHSVRTAQAAAGAPVQLLPQVRQRALDALALGLLLAAQPAERGLALRRGGLRSGARRAGVLQRARVRRLGSAPQVDGDGQGWSGTVRSGVPQGRVSTSHAGGRSSWASPSSAACPSGRRGPAAKHASARRRAGSGGGKRGAVRVLQACAATTRPARRIMHLAAHPRGSPRRATRCARAAGYAEDVSGRDI